MKNKQQNIKQKQALLHRLSCQALFYNFKMLKQHVVFISTCNFWTFRSKACGIPKIVYYQQNRLRNVWLPYFEKQQQQKPTNKVYLWNTITHLGTTRSRAHNVVNIDVIWKWLTLEICMLNKNDASYLLQSIKSYRLKFADTPTGRQINRRTNRHT